MNGKHPKCVITDGDLSMKNAIKRIFPAAHHRLCACHICNNAEKNIKKNNFHKDFQKVMWTKKTKNIEGVNFQQCELSIESVKTSRYEALSDACRVRK
ncbi:hypothetical protein Lal_00038307 [Lupinus albus]|nr:hypothetical protein Lal_00038307 [Lupinus albus]